MTVVQTGARAAGRDVGVGADDEADLAVEEDAHRLDLGGRLGVEIDDHRVGLLAQRRGRHRRLDGAERIVDRVHEDAAECVDHQHLPAVARRNQVGATAGRSSGHVERAEKRRLALDIAQRVALVEGMIAQRHHVGPGIAQAAEMPLGEAAPMAGILAVDDDEIETEALDQAGQPVADRIAPCPADDITQEQDAHQAAPPKLR